MILAGAELRLPRRRARGAAALNTPGSARAPPRRAAEGRRGAPPLPRRALGLRGAAQAVGLRAGGRGRRAAPNLRRACKDNFLSFMRVREWIEVHRQLLDIVRELKLGRDAGLSAPPTRRHPPTRAATRPCTWRSLTGLLSKVGQWSPEKRSVPRAPSETRFMVHPSSALAKKPPAWVMAFELVETSQLFARTGAKIEPEWLLEAAPAPGQEELRRAPLVGAHRAGDGARRPSTLYGLTIIRDRSVDLYAHRVARSARLMFSSTRSCAASTSPRAPSRPKPRRCWRTSRACATRRGRAT
jgi:ATP-dependent helicase HrpA